MSYLDGQREERGPWWEWTSLFKRENATNFTREECGGEVKITDRERDRKEVDIEGGGWVTGNLMITTQQLSKPFFSYLEALKQLTTLLVWLQELMPAHTVASFLHRTRMCATWPLVDGGMTRLCFLTVKCCLLDWREMKVVATADNPLNLFQSKLITSFCDQDWCTHMHVCAHAY